jgi:hypothetical protein
MNLKIDMNMEEVAADFEKTNNEEHIKVRQNYLCCCLNTSPDATLRRFHYCFDNFKVHFDYENESYDLIQDTTHIIEMRAVCSNIMLKDVRVLSLAWYELGKTFYDVSRMVARECLLVADFLRTTFPDYERGQEKIEDLRRELNDENDNGEERRFITVNNEH